jgi:hypothetical protein
MSRDIYMRQYGVAAKVRRGITKRSVLDLAVSADWTPATGDVKVSKDGGAIANVGTLPAVITGSAMWEYPFSATEMQCAEFCVTVIDSATKAVEDDQFTIMTFGGNSSGFTMERFVAGGIVGTVSTANDAGTATTFRCSDITEATTSHYVGKQVWVMSSAAMILQYLGVITAYSLITAEGAFTVSPGSPTGETLASTAKVFIY